MSLLPDVLFIVVLKRKSLVIIPGKLVSSVELLVTLNEKFQSTKSVSVYWTDESTIVK